MDNSPVYFAFADERSEMKKDNNIIISKVKCKKCNQHFTIKFTSEFITVKCYCGVLIIYKNRNIRFVSNEEYKRYIKNIKGGG